MDNTIKTMQDIDDLIRGTMLYGTGGGGSAEKGKELLLESFSAGKEIKWTDIDDLPEDGWVCTALFMGPSSPPTEEEEQEKIAKGMTERVEKNMLEAAVKELEKELGIKFTAIVPVEPGGYNCPAPLAAAAKLEVAIVDGDLVGRAMPEVAQALPTTANHPICPITCCDPWGNVTVIRKTHSYAMAEALGKMLSLPAYEPIGLAAFPMKIKDLKEVFVRGTLTKFLKIGREAREAHERGEDAIKTLAKASEGFDFFRGEITKFDWGIVKGYFEGDIYVEGKDDYAGKELHLWFRNENHLAYVDGELLVTTPDLITLVLEETGAPLVNMDLKVGMNVGAIAIPHPVYRTEAGMKLLGPEHYGLDIQYKPVEEVLG
ncbi:DUF917 domain-containing protein [Irregularibacter muris]|uniref:DUF917 domain-containing protein n=1 Tax=Irregularibacter muris TaxID=1796619 RepID=A0AAE3HGF4_9FIRM|nr:DUF917 domain-containing protein [Irregularibacter muris]MCR1900171.1 DUF917 domain-containing protein [Irregularibacter muris]